MNQQATQHTQASRLYRGACAELPGHTMHVHARMVVCMYFARRYGPRANKHRGKLAAALERMDG